MKLTGKIERSDVEGGMWILVTKDGDRYQLSGAVAGLRDGETMEVTGNVERNMMGFGMGGANFVVTSVGGSDKKAKAKPKAKSK